MPRKKKQIEPVAGFTREHFMRDLEKVAQPLVKKCNLAGCEEIATKHITGIVGGEADDGSFTPRQQVKVEICEEHYKQVVRGVLNWTDFSIGARTPRHSTKCRYSADGGWDCAPGCPTGVRGLHSV